MFHSNGVPFVNVGVATNWNSTGYFEINHEVGKFENRKFEKQRHDVTWTMKRLSITNHFK